MKNIIKKIGISIFTMILVSGIFVIGNSQNVLADGEEFTVNFHYTRSDANYTNYMIKAYSITDSDGQSGEFVVNGNEGTFSYTFARDVELDDQVRVVIQSVGENANTEVEGVIDISSVSGNTVDVAIDGDNKTVGIMESSSVNNDSNITSTNDATVAAETTVKPDDPNADYSVATVKVVIIDIVILVIIGGSSFLVFSKSKKPII